MFKNLVSRIQAWRRRIRKFVTEDVWILRPEELSKRKARLAKDVKVVTVTLRTFSRQKIGFQAVALSYFCTMAIVPLLAVAFAITNGFGLEDKLVEIVLSLDISKELVDVVLAAADSVFSSATNDIFGFIGAISFIWIIIWMMMRVEAVFNSVWKVSKPKRSMLKRLGVDIAITVLAPFVVLVLYSGTIVYSQVLSLIPNSAGFMDYITSFVGWLITGAAVVMIFSAMYKYIPATHVKYRYALKAAVLSGVAFTVLQYLYLETQVMVLNVNKIYGTMAVIPLFMVWMRMAWQIILYGAQFSYGFQMVDEMETRRLPVPESDPCEDDGPETCCDWQKKSAAESETCAESRPETYGGSEPDKSSARENEFITNNL